MKRPAFQFYPADWRKDAGAQSCSIAARGLWLEMLCIMHECDPYGHLHINGRPVDAPQLARLVGITPRECNKLLAELETNAVFSRTDANTIYSRRMVRDEALREVRATGGGSGAEHGHKGGAHGSKGGRPKKDKGGYNGGLETPLTSETKPPLKPPPSSSSSSSPSGSVSKDTGGAPPIALLETPKDRLWRLALPYLQSNGTPEKQARGIIGKWLKGRTPEVVLKALAKAQTEQAIDPVPYIERLLTGHSAQSNSYQTGML